MRLRTLALASLVLGPSALLSGCPRSYEPPPVPWDGGQLDGSMARLDTDGDGLCDDQERMRGTAVDDADTDGDGFSDFVEASLWYDPLRPASPPREEIVLLPEREGGEARVVFEMQVTGTGQSFTGSFQSSSMLYPDGITAHRFLGEARALTASPLANVFEVQEQTETFVRVVGRTRLRFEVVLRSADPRLGCLRAYPFQYALKRDDGRVVAVKRFTVVIAPEGMRPGEGEWCGARPCW